MLPHLLVLNGPRGRLGVFPLLLQPYYSPISFLDCLPKMSSCRFQLQFLVGVFYVVCEKFILGGGITCSIKLMPKDR
jgi:hypothetical protein